VEVGEAFEVQQGWPMPPQGVPVPVPWHAPVAAQVGLPEVEEYKVSQAAPAPTQLALL
jgi:hypothetical protein